MLAGCTSSSFLSHREFTRRASGVCDSANRRVGTTTGSLGEPDAATVTLTYVVGVERDALVHLRRLHPPARDAAKIDEWLAVHAQLVAELDTVRQALQAKQLDEAAVGLDHAAILAGRVDALARASGIRPCRFPIPQPA